jgi:biofilm PGA synthesis lipoprotein PgaB
MRALLLKLLICAAVLAAPLHSVAATEFQVLAYHDVRDFVREKVDADQYAISTRNLIDHFNWLKANGFVPVSMDAIVEAQAGRGTLPDKAVLITFDDGFRSVYTHVYPLLRLFNYPAVISVVTAWIDGDVPPPADDPTLANHEFLTWDEIREMQASGLVEIASHSHDLHHGLLANPQGNEQPAAKARRYLDGRYETAEEYAVRVRADLDRSAVIIEQHTGRRPRVMTWPYGAYSGPLVEIAKDLGMPITMSLSNGRNTTDSLAALARHLVQSNPEVTQLGYDLLYHEKPGALRVAQVDLDYIYDPDPAQQERNLGHLLDRIKTLKISHVFLQAFADPDADGGAQAAYFPNRHLPMRADLFNRALWQLRTRAGVAVYGWLPILAYDAPDMAGIDRVTQWRDGMLVSDANAEPRLSPFSSEARRIIAEIYEDLAVAAPLDGILFHDDGRLNEFEDASPAAMAAYRDAFGPDFSVAATLTDPDLQQRWARFKTRAIIDLTNELERVVRRYQPSARFARNAFSATLLDPDGERYLAQDYREFLGAYDHVALMAMPYFENAGNAQDFYEDLITQIAAIDGAFAKTIFELQTVDWRTNTPLPAPELRTTMRWLQSRGIRHIGYYPDDFIQGQPQLPELREGISLAQYPIEVP